MSTCTIFFPRFQLQGSETNAKDYVYHTGDVHWRKTIVFEAWRSQTLLEICWHPLRESQRCWNNEISWRWVDDMGMHYNWWSGTDVQNARQCHEIQGTGCFFARKTWCHCLHRIGCLHPYTFQLNAYAQLLVPWLSGRTRDTFEGTYTYTLRVRLVGMKILFCTIQKSLNTTFFVQEPPPPVLWFLEMAKTNI